MTSEQFRQMAERFTAYAKACNQIAFAAEEIAKHTTRCAELRAVDIAGMTREQAEAHAEELNRLVEEAGKARSIMNAAEVRAHRLAKTLS